MFIRDRMIRLFAAVPIMGEIAQGLAGRQSGLPGARWRPVETLHITLRFFGEVSERVADDLDQALEGVRGAAFDLTLNGAGLFGDGERLRAVWAGVEDSPPLTQLASRCEAAARRAGVKPETRVFKPHVTLAYLKHADPAKVAAYVQTNNLLKSPPFRVERFGLYSSWPSETVSAYRLERLYRLA